MRLTGASRDTSRRDTIKLADSKLAVRNYGGISLANAFNKLAVYLDRTDQDVQVKKQLAQAASQLIQQQHQLYLDVSTTVSYLPQFLTKKHTDHVMTNSLDIADQMLQHTAIPTTLLGGELNKESRAVIGGYPIWELAHYQFDFSILSCAGLDNRGIYYAYEEDIALKNAIRDHSQQIIMLADNTKINTKHNYLVYPFEKIDYLVTNKPLPQALMRNMKHTKIIYTKDVN